jgi:hypothetical protein
MATNRTFQDMLNQYLTYDLLKAECIKRDYFLSRVEKDDGWKGGTLIVPFKGAYATSVKYGSLTAANDVHEDQYVRGQITTQPEVWGTMKFGHKDIIQHDGKVNEKSFLKLLPDSLDDFMDTFKQIMSTQLLGSSEYVQPVAFIGGGTGGIITVDRVERMYLGQKFRAVDSDAVLTTADVYVIAIDINTDQVTFSETRGGAALDWTNIGGDDWVTNTIAKLQLYIDGSETAANRFAGNARDVLLSNANGGAANLYGQAKTAYPFLQAVNHDGSTITATNILEKIYDFYVKTRRLGKGKPNEVLMSFKNFGNVVKNVELGLTSTNEGKFPYRMEGRMKNAMVFDYDFIEISGPQGALRVVAIQEMDDDVMYFMDWRNVRFHSNGFIRKRTAPDGKQFYEVRETTGYYYLIDLFLLGDAVWSKPAHCGVVHTISY